MKDDSCDIGSMGIGWYLKGNDQSYKREFWAEMLTVQTGMFVAKKYVVGSLGFSRSLPDFSI